MVYRSATALEPAAVRPLEWGMMPQACGRRQAAPSDQRWLRQVTERP